MNVGKKMIGGSALALALAAAWPLLAAPVDKVTAEAAANGWLADQASHLTARLHAQVKQVEPGPGFNIFHLQPEGFVVMSADDELEPVLAFSDNGDLTPDPESPLWIMLNREVPARAEHLRQARARQAGSLKAKVAVAAPAVPGDTEVLAAAQNARARWDKYKQFKPQSPLAATATALAVASGGGTNDTDGLDASSAVASPIHIQDIKIIGGHVQLTHDAAGSVTVYASYDCGQTWQVQDSGIVWPNWTARQPVQESSCWYRLAADQIYDEQTVSLMRNPPPGPVLPAVMSTDEASAPDSDPGLSSSANSVSDVRVAPLVQSTWNQTTEKGANCYNYYTPNNYYDGCVATAMAQLMRYWQFPTAGIGQVTRTVYVNGAARSATTRGGNGSGGAYTWSSMPLSPSSATYNLAQWQMIGALCFDSGVGVNMQYSGSGSGAYMYLCASALTGVFQYANAKYVNYPADLLLPTDSNLAAGYPVLFGISASGRSGHAIVCDGFGYASGTLYHHINFGWGGAYNVWYALPYLETSYGFNRIDTIIYNVFPSGTGELLTGRVMTGQGAPVPSATVVATSGGVNYSGTTDAKGYYGLKVPSAKTYSVTASKLAMGTGTRTGVAIGTSSTSASGNRTGIDFTLNNTFSFSAIGGIDCVWLRWSAPSASGFPNDTVYVRSRTDHYPTTSTDGNLVYTGTAQTYQDTDANTSGTVTNYYTIWANDGSPYASLGNNVNSSAVADSGKARMFWTRSTGEVLFWNLKADGTKKSSGYVASGQLNMSYWKPCGFGDIDGDGTADILWTGNGGEVVYWLLNADGTQKAAGRVVAGNATSSGYWKVVGFGDIDGDGTADILWTGNGGEVLYWMLNADGTRKSAGRVVAGNATSSGYWKAVGFGDIDGDGTADILWTGNGGEVLYWMLNADGTRKSAGRVVAGNATSSGYWKVAGFGDIDGDGTADILWTGSGGDLVYWLLNADGTRKSAGRVYAGNVTRSGYWVVSGFMDIDGDGTADIIWRGGGGETKYWLLNANGTYKSAGNVDAAAVSPSVWSVRGLAPAGP